MWLNKLTVAVIERDFPAIEKLLEDIPALNEEDARKAAHLLDNLSEYFQEKKDETALNMRQLKKNIDFVKSTEPERKHRLDIKS